jgi:hypothetical protein
MENLRMSWPMPSDNSYRVEVSGWNELESFFVERTSLLWDPSEGTQISLHSRIRDGAIVFVRLLQPVANGNAFPVAYRIRRIEGPDAEGNAKVWIEQMRPQLEKREPREDLLTKVLPPIN